ncbi:hypothetical protein CEXT_498411 [Caerostris extrusa]|uniref:Uncharacterized protein n=1 Tax=Caerostris extrusa TaxID=172846 RepID=A0AAV4TJQ9_CAEEX|nr:hypothetical protein CEXT_498411 [Caerostris extrusa]
MVTINDANCRHPVGITNYLLEERALLTSMTMMDNRWCVVKQRSLRGEAMLVLSAATGVCFYGYGVPQSKTNFEIASNTAVNYQSVPVISSTLFTLATTLSDEPRSDLSSSTADLKSNRSFHNFSNINIDRALLPCRFRLAPLIGAMSLASWQPFYFRLRSSKQIKRRKKK